MTIFVLALAIAACIGWTAHTRMLRCALHEAWAEIDALEAESDAEERHAGLSAESRKLLIAGIEDVRACRVRRLDPNEFDSE